jgi:hypothetical protein
MEVDMIIFLILYCLQCFFKSDPPITKETTKSTKKKKKRILATAAAPSAIPVKPKIAAMIAMIKNVNDHLSMIFPF